MSLDPAVFDKAAEIIETKGWSKDEFDPCVCVWIALLDGFQHYNGSLIGFTPYEDELKAHCQVGTLSGLWALNDSQPEETGAAWAIKVHQDIAASLRMQEPGTVEEE